MTNYNCAFCRNQGATNEHEYDGDFIYVMCDGCDERYKQYKQLGPKYVYCLCNPDKPRELEIGMAGSEIAASKVPTHEMTNIEIVTRGGIDEGKIKELSFENESQYVNKTYPNLDKAIKDESKKPKIRISGYDKDGNPEFIVTKYDDNGQKMSDVSKKKRRNIST